MRSLSRNAAPSSLAASMRMQQVKERKWHNAAWKKKGELIRSIQKVQAELSNEIGCIIGTAPDDEAAAPRLRYFTKDEVTRLVNAAQGDFRNLVLAALHTGCRYGELTRLRAGDFNPDSGTVFVGQSKSGKARHVVLTDEGRRFFET